MNCVSESFWKLFLDILRYVVILPVDYMKLSYKDILNLSVKQIGMLQKKNLNFYSRVLGVEILREI